VGTDIISVDRLRKNIEEKSATFLSKVFTDKEILYCNSKANPAIHFSGRFAAKEAVKKAILSSKMMQKISMKNIEILSDNNIPVATVNLLGLRAHITLSISHSDEFATATAILISSNENI